MNLDKKFKNRTNQLVKVTNPQDVAQIQEVIQQQRSKYALIQFSDSFQIDDKFLERISNITIEQSLDWVISSITEQALTFRQLKSPIIVSENFLIACKTQGYLKAEEMYKIVEFVAGGAQIPGFNGYTGKVIPLTNEENTKMLIDNFGINYSFPHYIYFSSTN